MAFNLFAEENVDIAVIEVDFLCISKHPSLIILYQKNKTFIFSLKAGLGGARDATNIISSSDLAASVITTIGEEHLAALGGSLESIAVAKSGIIKHGCSVRWFSQFPYIDHINIFYI